MQTSIIRNNKAIRFIVYNLVAIATAILVIVTIIIEPNFLTTSNIINILGRFGSLSVVSLGMTLVLICGYLDLSVAGLLSFCAVVSGALVGTLGAFPTLIITLAVGAGCGFLTSTIVLEARAKNTDTAVFITYGMSQVYSALALLLSGGSAVSVPNDATVFKLIGQGKIGIIPYSFIIFLVVLIILHVFMSKTRYGRYAFLAGGNPLATDMAGISTKKTIRTMFVILGGLTGLGAVLAFSRQALITPSMGKNYEVNALMSAVIGGTSMTGGKGSVLRTVFGVLLIIILVNTMDMLGVSSDLQDVMKGTILIFAIWLDHLREGS